MYICHKISKNLDGASTRPISGVGCKWLWGVRGWVSLCVGVRGGCGCVCAYGVCGWSVNGCLRVECVGVDGCVWVSVTTCVWCVCVCVCVCVRVRVWVGGFVWEVVVWEGMSAAFYVGVSPARGAPPPQTKILGGRGSFGQNFSLAPSALAGLF